MLDHSSKLFRLSTRSIALALFALVFAGALPAAAVCNPGVSSVSVGLISGTTSDDTDRREHAHISDTLASLLGITSVNANGDVSPQVRVIIDSPSIDGLTSSTATFTVTQIFSDASKLIRVYAKQSSGDDDSGFFKLFVNNDSLNLATVSATVHPFGPSKSTIVDGGSTVSESFCEPAGNGSGRYFREKATVESDKRFILLVPHGGAIEVKVSDQVSPVVNLLGTSYAIDANVWEGEGKWGNNQTFQRWHTTSSSFDPATFPGLEYLFDETDYALDVPFQYALALHGFGWSGKGAVIGGRASREAKCLVVKRIQDELAAAGRTGDVAFYVFDLGGNDVSIPDKNGIRVENKYGITGLRGLDNENIVNRMSPNATSADGSGGIQVEQSSGVRNDTTLRNAMAEGAATAIGELITAPPVGSICSTL